VKTSIIAGLVAGSVVVYNLCHPGFQTSIS